MQNYHLCAGRKQDQRSLTTYWNWYKSQAFLQSSLCHKTGIPFKVIPKTHLEIKHTKAIHTSIQIVMYLSAEAKWFNKSKSNPNSFTTKLSHSQTWLLTLMESKDKKATAERVEGLCLLLILVEEN